MYVCLYLLICVWLFVTPWTVAHQDPLTIEFSRQEYWSRLPFLSPGDLPDSGIKSMFLTSPALAGGFSTTMPPRKPILKYLSLNLLLRFIRGPMTININSKRLPINYFLESCDGCHGSESESPSVMSNSLLDSGQNTGVGSLSLLQGIFPTQGLNPGLLHCRWILYQLRHKGSLSWKPKQY